ncbi:MAG: YqaA family protein [Pseudomonadota bacterium]
MIRRLYDWTLSLAAKPHALTALALISFTESSFFPIPPDVLLIPMVLAARDRAWLIAAVCTAASVIGGLAGYGIGYFLFESIGQPVLGFYGYEDRFAAFRTTYDEWGALIVFGAGLTPFPFKVITIASGVFQMNIVVFALASVIARGSRFFLVAALLYWFGPVIRDFIEKRLGLLTILFFVMLVGGFVLLRYVV